MRGLLNSTPVIDFILTCNYKSRIIEPIHSRCVVDYIITNPKKNDLFMKRCFDILKQENIEYDIPVVADSL